MSVRGRRLYINQDVAAGLMFMVAGAFFVWFGRHYATGTALRMGPGYLPTLLGWLLISLGSFVAGRGMLSAGDRMEAWALRPLFAVCGAFLVFSWLITDLGLIVTGILAMLCAAVGGAEFHLREQAVVASAAAVAGSAIFIYALGLPMHHWPQIFER